MAINEIFTVIALGFATLFDLRVRKIPNLITIPAILMGFLIMSYRFGLSGTINSLEGFAVGIFVLLPLFAIGAMGAGDVKLMAAVGALNGWHFVIFAFLYTAIAGGVIAIVMLFLKGQLRNVLFNIFIGLTNYVSLLFKKGFGQPLLPVNSGIRFPYAVAILIGTCAAFYLR